jgi:hypothetical protein
MSLAELAELKRQLEELLEVGWIVLSKAMKPWCFSKRSQMVHSNFVWITGF